MPSTSAAGRPKKKRQGSALDALLESLVGGAGAAPCPPSLARALRYAVIPGGSRIRPQLLLSVASACGDRHPALALRAAASLELLHCASLVHDDLPCFDDADQRRGRPSVHRAFGQPAAVLVGDALIVLAFEALSEASPLPEMAQILGRLARSVGPPSGIIAGQAWESEARVDVATYHRAKTAALFVAAVSCGAIAGGGSPEAWAPLGERIGEAYQVADDLKDVLSTPSELGKPVCRDAALGRPSAVTELGVTGAAQRLLRLFEEAEAAVPPCPGRAAVIACFRAPMLEISARIPRPALRSLPAVTTVA